MLTTKQSCIYCGVSKPTFLKQKVPYSEGAKKGWKLYDPKILDEHFPNAPKIMPFEKKQVEVIPPTKLDFEVSEHQTAFTNILNKVKQLQGDNYQHEVSSTLIESIIKSSVLENHYFQELQSDPDNKEIYILWEKSTNLKINLSKRLGL